MKLFDKMLLRLRINTTARNAANDCKKDMHAHFYKLQIGHAHKNDTSAADA